MTIHETHKHYFQVADVGDTDNDQDRSIVPSINAVLQNEGIDCVVDGDEMNSAGFTVWTYSSRDTIQYCYYGRATITNRRSGLVDGCE